MLDNLYSVGCEVSGHLRNKRNEYQKEIDNEIKNVDIIVEE
jgi:hypothetical protein